MLNLVEILDQFYCPQAETAKPDTVVAFCHWVGGKELQWAADAELLTEFQRAKQALVKNYRLPVVDQLAKGIQFKYRNHDVHSDLFIPHCIVDADEIAHFTFPGFGYDYVSSKLLGFDWRYLLMAWPVRLNIASVSQVMFRVIYPSGHIVDAEVDPATWDVVGEAVLRVGATLHGKFMPGSICTRCQRCQTCEACQQFLDRNISGGEASQNKKDKAYRLLIERVGLRTQQELLARREREIQASLKRTLGNKPEFVIDGVMKVEPEIRSSTAFPSPKLLFELLQRSGLWKWDYVKVLATEVNDDLSRFPEALRRQVLALRKEVHRDASITEVLNGAEHHVQASIFRGVSL